MLAPVAFGIGLTSFVSAAVPPSVGGTLVTERAVLSATFTIDDGCSGFMISKSYGLTARHCDAHSGSKIQLNGSECSVISTTNPPGATDDRTNSDLDLHGDLTLLKVACPEAATADMIPFELPAPGEEIEGVVEVAGYGNGDLGLENSPLRKVQGIVTTDVQMLEEKSNLQFEGLPSLLAAIKSGRMICVTESPGKVEYHGDSGGPTYVATDGGFKAVGVNSTMLVLDKGFAYYHDLDASDSYGACNVKLSYYTSWVRSQIGTP
jgi:hypothetical protein